MQLSPKNNLSNFIKKPLDSKLLEFERANKTILEQNLDENILIDVVNFSLKKPSIDIYSDINK